MEGGPSIQERENEESQIERPTGCLNFFCHPLGSGHRFVALIFMCFLSFGSYFCYDNPAALQNYMKRDLNLTELQYTSLYSVYSWPNVILNFVGGFLIDRVFGIRLGSNIYVGLALLGQLIFATSVMFNQYWLMLVGRLVFGIGCESLTVAQNNYAVLWFKGKELNMVFGLQLSFARVGSTVNFLVMESLYKGVHNKIPNGEGQYILGTVLYVAATTCLISWVCSIVMGIFDKRSEVVLGRNNNPTGEIVQLSDVRYFKTSFWLVCIICVTFYCAVFPFITIAKEFFMKKFDFNPDDANYLSSIVYIISGISSPVLGFIIDKAGMNILWIFIGTSGTILSHVLLGFTTLNPYVAIIIMGMAYSILAASLWPLISLVIPEYQLGTAYGVAGAFQNLGLALFSIFTGIIVENCGYTAIEIFFISSLVAALIATLGLWIIDRKGDKSLNMTSAARRRLQLVSVDVERLIDPETIGSAADISEPNSDFHIRNRYLSRIGAPLPYAYDVDAKEISLD